MTIQAQTADGVIHEFPDDTPDTVIDKAMADYTQQNIKPQAAPTPAPVVQPKAVAAPAPKPAAPPAPKRSLSEDIAGGMSSLWRGTGIGDELAAAMSTPISAGADLLSGRAKINPLDAVNSAGGLLADKYKQALAHQRDIESGFAQAHPIAHGLLTGTGNALPAIAATVLPEAAPSIAEGMAPGVTQGLLARLAPAAARGATTAGLSAAGSAAADAGTIPERLQAAAKAARDPLTLAIGAATGGIGVPGVKTPKTPPAAELVASLKADAKGLYDDIEARGGAFRPEALAQLGKDILSDVSPKNRPGGVHPTLSPNAHAALFDEVLPRLMSGERMSLGALDEVKQAVRDATTPYASNITKRDRKLGYTMMGKIDDFISSMGPHNFATPVQLPWQPGASQAQAQTMQMMLGQAKDLWKRSAQIENISNRVTSATQKAATVDSGKNLANKIRQRLQPLIDPTRPNQMMRGLTDEQQAQLEKTVEPSRLEDVLRVVGKMDPTRGGLHSLGGAALALSHPQLVPAMVATTVARKFGDTMVQRNADKLISMIATGGANAKLAAQQLRAQMAANPEVAAYLERLRQTGAFGAGVSQGQQGAQGAPGGP